MGAILAIIGESGDPEIAMRFHRMNDRPAAGGRAREYREDGAIFAVHSLGWDASLAVWGRLVVAFHGYLANWREISRRHELDGGEDRSIAEQLAAAFAVTGERLFAEMEGEFALLVYDRGKRRLLALRDVVGCRPLFFEQKENRVFIGTEIRRVLAGSGTAVELYDDALVDHLLNLPLAREETHFRNVRRVLPGVVYAFDAAGPAADPARRTYWSPPPAEAGHYRLEDLAVELGERLERAVAGALPDQPFAMALSGGVDSATIWTIISALAASGDPKARHGKPYSLVYPGLVCDEQPIIEQLLERTGAEGAFIDASAMHPMETYPKLIDDTWSLFPLTFYQLGPLFSAAAGDGRRVVLTGLGPDDWLRGDLGYLADDLVRGRLARFVRDWLTFELPDGVSRGRLFNRLVRLAARRIVPGLRPPRRPGWLTDERWAEAAPCLRRAPWDDIRTPLSRRALLRDLEKLRSGKLLEPAAHYATQFGIEIRHPLLGMDMLRFAFTTPARAFIHGRRFKHLLRLSAGDRLPRPIRDRTRRVLFDCLCEPDARRVAASDDMDCWRIVQRGIVSSNGINNLFSDVLKDRAGRRSLLRVLELHLVELFVTRVEKVRSVVDNS